MAEKVRNTTRAALVLLIVAATLFMLVFVGELTGTSFIYSDIHDKDGWSYYFDTDDDDDDYQYDFDEHYDNAESWLFFSQPAAFFLRVCITILLFIGMIVLFFDRKSYGIKHSNKVTNSLLLSFLSLSILLCNYFPLSAEEETIIGAFTGIAVILFIGALFLATYEIGGRRRGFIGLVLGTLSVVPLMLIKYELHYGDDMWTGINFGIRPILQYIIVADFGLFISMSFLLAAMDDVWKYTKQYPSSPSEPHEPDRKEIEEVTRPKKAMKAKTKNTNKRAMAIALVIIVVISTFGIYWFAIRTPELQEFMEGSYSDGEKAEFRATVEDIEIIETSYGTCTLVTFTDFDMPFCFIGDRSDDYKVGKSAVTKVQFHKYDIDGVKRVLLKELILSSYLLFDDVFSDYSYYGGMNLEGEMPDNDSENFHLQVDTVRYGERNFSLELYDHSLNRVWNDEDDFYCRDEFYNLGMGTKESHYPEKGSFLHDNFDLLGAIWLHLSFMGGGDVNCSGLKSEDTYLADRIAPVDDDGNGMLGPGDGFRLDIPATNDKYHFNYYVFNVAGITSGMKVILNWHGGPFYRFKGGTYYTQGPIELDNSSGSFVHRAPVADVTGEPYQLSDIIVCLSEMGYSPITVPFPVLADGATAEVVIKGEKKSVTFTDGGNTGLLDAGDIFEIRGLDNDTFYEFWIRESDYDMLMRWDFETSGEESVGNYLIPTMAGPSKSEGNITFELETFTGAVTLYSHLRFNLTIPEKGMLLSLECEDESTNVSSLDGSIEISFNNSDENDYFTPGDSITIRGLDIGVGYTFQIMLNSYMTEGDFPLFTYNGIV